MTTHFRTTVPDVVALPQHFKNHGYFTQSVGKIYHGGLDDPISWSEPPRKAYRAMYALEENEELVASKRAAAAGKKFATPSQRYNAMTGPPYECADVPDNTHSDGAIADAAIDMLRKAKEKEEPFFIAAGFLKPHLPFIAPKKYWDMYQREEIPAAPNPFPPKDAPKLALTNWGELRAYEDIPHSGPLTASKATPFSRRIPRSSANKLDGPFIPRALIITLRNAVIASVVAGPAKTSVFAASARGLATPATASISQGYDHRHPTHRWREASGLKTVSRTGIIPQRAIRREASFWYTRWREWSGFLRIDPRLGLVRRNRSGRCPRRGLDRSLALQSRAVQRKCSALESQATADASDLRKLTIKAPRRQVPGRVRNTVMGVLG